jgi:hypothetical protein
VYFSPFFNVILVTLPWKTIHIRPARHAQREELWAYHDISEQAQHPIIQVFHGSCCFSDDSGVLRALRRLRSIGNAIGIAGIGRALGHRIALGPSPLCWFTNGSRLEMLERKVTLTVVNKKIVALRERMMLRQLLGGDRM